ncbi:DNA-binding protein [Trichinella pseudospiralis]
MKAYQAKKEIRKNFDQFFSKFKYLFIKKYKENVFQNHIEFLIWMKKKLLSTVEQKKLCRLTTKISN